MAPIQADTNRHKNESKQYCVDLRLAEILKQQCLSHKWCTSLKPRGTWPAVEARARDVLIYCTDLRVTYLFTIRDSTRIWALPERSYIMYGHGNRWFGVSRGQVRASVLVSDILYYRICHWFLPYSLYVLHACVKVWPHILHYDGLLLGWKRD